MRWGDKLRSRQWSPPVRSACAVILFYVLLTHLDVLGRVLLSFLNFFLPIILGVCIAYILNPLVGFVQGKVSKRVYFFYAAAVTISPSDGGIGKGDE